MIEVIHADALDLEPEFFAGFDTLIVDPPYSEHVHESAASVGSNGMFPGTQNNRDRDLGFSHLSDALRAHIAMIAASVTRWSAIYSDVESTHLWRESCDAMGVEYIRPLPWIRWSQPQLSGDRPCTILEIVSIFHAQYNGPRGGQKPVQKHWSGPGNIMPACSRELLVPLQHRALRGADKHPTEKRLSQLLDLVSWFSDPGESVIDPTAGSCTTALATRLLGRDCVCIDLDAEWARRGQVRATTMLSPRDRADAEEWAALTFTEASEQLDKPAASDGSDRNTRERAERRLADVERVLGAL
jgi:site-specific DNA-methyltransferase (adenine-specific)